MGGWICFLEMLWWMMQWYADLERSQNLLPCLLITVVVSGSLCGVPGGFGVGVSVSVLSHLEVDKA
eukprot:7942452-Ditylum_brightwellii.AAC.1